jgi:hypothetical protein
MQRGGRILYDRQNSGRENMHAGNLGVARGTRGFGGDEKEVLDGRHENILVYLICSASYSRSQCVPEVSVSLHLRGR